MGLLIHTLRTMLSNLELLFRCQKPLMQENRQVGRYLRAGSALHRLMLVHILRAVLSNLEAIFQCQRPPMQRTLRNSKAG